MAHDVVLESFGDLPKDWLAPDSDVHTTFFVVLYIWRLLLIQDVFVTVLESFGDFPKDWLAPDSDVHT
jgi:rubredoxin